MTADAMRDQLAMRANSAPTHTYTTTWVAPGSYTSDEPTFAMPGGYRPAFPAAAAAVAAAADFERAQQSLRRLFADTGEALNTFVEQVNAWAAQMGIPPEDLADALTRLMAEPALPTPEPPRGDPATHALTMRQTRSTGPHRPSGQTARRPRRHQ